MPLLHSLLHNDIISATQYLHWNELNETLRILFQGLPVSSTTCKELRSSYNKKKVEQNKNQQLFLDLSENWDLGQIVVSQTGQIGTHIESQFTGSWSQCWQELIDEKLVHAFLTSSQFLNL